MSEAQALLVAVAVILIIGRRFIGSPVGAKSMVVPLALMGAGVAQIHGHLTSKDIALLAVEVVVSLAAGVARAYTIKLFLKDGHLWQRYTVITLLVWIAMIAVRVGFAAFGHWWGATLASGATVMIAFGFSIFVEALVVSMRASQTGAPIMPKQTRNGRRFARGL
jgi:hypothetical protein